MMKPVGAATPDTSVPKPTILVQNCSMNSSASSGDALVAVRPADVDRAKFPSPVTGCAGLDLIDLLHHVQLAGCAGPAVVGGLLAGLDFVFTQGSVRDEPIRITS